MAQETFEAQAAAIRNALRGKITESDRSLLRQAESNLTQLAALRKKCLVAANSNGSVSDLGEELCDEIIKLLHLPTEA